MLPVSLFLVVVGILLRSTLTFGFAGSHSNFNSNFNAFACRSSAALSAASGAGADADVASEETTTSRRKLLQSTFSSAVVLLVGAASSPAVAVAVAAEEEQTRWLTGKAPKVPGQKPKDKSDVSGTRKDPTFLRSISDCKNKCESASGPTKTKEECLSDCQDICCNSYEQCTFGIVPRI
jgi:hypothetical protein